MNFQTIVTLNCMENGKTVYTIKLDNLLNYNFVWDSSKLCTLYLVTSSLNINDLNMLITKPYEAYVLIGLKKIFEGDKEKTYSIPARVFRHLIVKGDYKTTELTFYETWSEKDND